MPSDAEPTYAELAATEQRIRGVLTAGAEERLRAIDGVLHVSVGLKERGNQVTTQQVIRVYVRQKRPADQIPPAELIPPEIDGIPTDVNVVKEYGFTADNARYRPILGGIGISNRIIDANEDMTGTQVSRGTLGCIATLTADRSPVLLTNWHVLMANGARVDDKVFQPPPTSIPPTDLADLPVRPKDDDDVIGKIAKSAITEKVDGAIARINVSSCCRCCGIDFQNKIKGLSVSGHPPTDAIVGQRPAVSGMQVFKVGRVTGRTAGHVVDPNFPEFSITRQGTTYTFTGQIQIAGEDTVVPFSDHGDSGAVVIDADGFIVGLHFASNGQPGQNSRAIANHIADVCHELGITINTTPTSPSAGARVEVPAMPEATGAYRAWRERLLTDPAGARLLELAEEHRAEIVQLVNHNRRVTVAWHRNHGPAFLATALRTVRDGGDELPKAVQGLRLDAALERLGAALAAHGSTALRRDVVTLGPMLLPAVRASVTIDDLLANLRGSGFGLEFAGAEPTAGPAHSTQGRRP